MLTPGSWKASRLIRKESPDALAVGVDRAASCSLATQTVSKAGGASFAATWPILESAVRAEMITAREIGGHPWPDPSCAAYRPSTPDDELQGMAYRGATAIAAEGIAPSQRNLWRWCVEHGVRKRQRVGLRIVQRVLSALSAGEVAASVVRDVQQRRSEAERSTAAGAWEGMGCLEADTREFRLGSRGWSGAENFPLGQRAHTAGWCDTAGPPNSASWEGILQ